MAEGKVDPFNLLIDINKKADLIYYGTKLEEMQIKGQAIWFAYKYYSKSNLDNFLNSIRTNDTEMLRFLKLSGFKHIKLGEEK